MPSREESSPEEPKAATPVPGTGDPSRLEDLQEEIDEVRRDVADQNGETGQHFFESGDRPGQEVDDGIAPPG